MKTQKMKMVVLSVIFAAMLGCGGDLPSVNGPNLNHNQTGLDDVDGQMPVEVLVTGLHQPYAVHYDYTHVYFLSLLDEPYEMDLMKVAKSGGAPAVLATRIHAFDIAVDASNVYWVDQSSGAVMTISKFGGIPWALTLGSDDPVAWDIEADMFYVYWTNSTSVLRVSKWGGLRRVLAFIEYPSSLVLDNSFVYTYSGTPLGGGSMSVVKIPKVGGLPLPVAGPLNDCALMVGVDKQHLYFKTFWGGDLMRVSKHFYGEPEKLAEGVVTGGHTAIMDKEYIYLGQIDEVQRVPKDGGAVETLAYGDNWDVVCSLSADDTHIYASTFGPYDQKQGAILKIDKNLPEPF